MTTDHSMVELPHARLSGGPGTLLVLEGLTLENRAPGGRALWLLRWAYKRYTRDYTVYQVARRPGLPAGATTRDFFYPEPVLRETAERIPNATLRLYDGVGHPVGKTHKRRFEDDVLGFLNG